LETNRRNRTQIDTLVEEFPPSQLLVDATISQNSAQKEADEASAYLEAERDNEDLESSCDRVEAEETGVAGQQSRPG
jgi:hypothetical protein